MKALLATVAIAATVPLAACGTDDAASSRGDCPAEPLDVVVTVSQWSDITDQLAGDCGAVTTIVNGTSVDPHDFEPTTGDAATVSKTQLLVENGLGYDEWANKLIATQSTKPAVVDAGEVVGLPDGANPHIWYGPTYVFEVADAITAELRQLSPAAASYFEKRNVAWKRTMKPYRDRIAAIKASYGGKRTYAATESVFDDMATALGLRDVTPPGYRRAAANESEPAPGDVHAFEQVLRDDADVLVYNVQTEGSIPGQLRASARSDGVPVVEVTETMPPGVETFERWQVDQLRRLSAALARS